MGSLVSSPCAEGSLGRDAGRRTCSLGFQAVTPAVIIALLHAAETSCLGVGRKQCHPVGRAQLHVSLIRFPEGTSGSRTSPGHRW